MCLSVLFDYDVGKAMHGYMAIVFSEIIFLIEILILCIHETNTFYTIRSVLTKFIYSFNNIQEARAA